MGSLSCVMVDGLFIRVTRVIGPCVMLSCRGLAQAFHMLMAEREGEGRRICEAS